VENVGGFAGENEKAVDSRNNLSREVKGGSQQKGIAEPNWTPLIKKNGEGETRKWECLENEEERTSQKKQQECKLTNGGKEKRVKKSTRDKKHCPKEKNKTE